jgi:hypothetical protein
MASCCIAPYCILFDCECVPCVAVTGALHGSVWTVLRLGAETVRPWDLAWKEQWKTVNKESKALGNLVILKRHCYRKFIDKRHWYGQFKDKRHYVLSIYRQNTLRWTIYIALLKYEVSLKLTEHFEDHANVVEWLTIYIALLKYRASLNITVYLSDWINKRILILLSILLLSTSSILF